MPCCCWVIFLWLTVCTGLFNNIAVICILHHVKLLWGALWFAMTTLTQLALQHTYIMYLMERQLLLICVYTQYCCFQEMVLSLCQHVQTFLHAHNKPPTKSFYDEMLLNQQRQEMKKAKAMEKQLELQRQKDEKTVVILLFVFIYCVWSGYMVTKLDYLLAWFFLSMSALGAFVWTNVSFACFIGWICSAVIRAKFRSKLTL